MSSQQPANVPATIASDWRATLITKPRLLVFCEWLIEQAAGQEKFELRWNDASNHFEKGPACIKLWVKELVNLQLLTSKKIDTLTTEVFLTNFLTNFSPSLRKTFLAKPAKPPAQGIFLDSADRELVREFEQRKAAMSAELGNARELSQPSSARDSLERSNVLPLAQRKDVLQNVPKNVDLQRPAENVAGDQIRHEVRRLHEYFGPPHERYGWTPYSYALAVTKGPLSRAAYESIVECTVRNRQRWERWDYAFGALKGQLALLDPSLVKAAGMWNDKKDEPGFHRFPKLRSILHPLGLWDPSWNRSRAPPRPR